MKRICYLPWVVPAVCMVASSRYPTHFQAISVLGIDSLARPHSSPEASLPEQPA